MIYVTSSSKGEQDVARLNDHRRAPWLPVAGTGAGRLLGQEESAAPAPAAAPPPLHRTGGRRQVQSMGTEQLRESASQALRENRMYAPAGDNAIEYYLALRDKTPDDASVKSALTDLLPYTLIAAEQHLGREDYTEAQRLVALIEKVDASAPALPRLKDGGWGVQNAPSAPRPKPRGQEGRRGPQQAADRTAAPGRAACQEADAAKQIAAQQDAARRDNERQEAERQAAARRAEAAAGRRPAGQCRTPGRGSSGRCGAEPAPGQHPAPRYPSEALRAGTSGEVLVEITVGTDGSVTNARVLRATPSRVFDREAMNAVKRWRFEPVSAPVTTAVPWYSPRAAPDRKRGRRGLSRFRPAMRTRPGMSGRVRSGELSIRRCSAGSRAASTWNRPSACRPGSSHADLLRR